MLLVLYVYVGYVLCMLLQKIENNIYKNEIDIHPQYYYIPISRDFTNKQTTEQTMDLTQSKLSRAEWNSIEISVPEAELSILKMINEGSANVNIKANRHLSIIQFNICTHSKRIFG